MEDEYTSFPLASTPRWSKDLAQCLLGSSSLPSVRQGVLRPCSIAVAKRCAAGGKSMR